MVQERKPEVLVYGLGGIGGYYTWLIQKNANVTALARSNYKVLKEKGQFIRSCTYGEVLNRLQRVIHVDNIKEATDREYDFVVCSAKAYVDIPPTNAEFLKPVIGPNTTIVLVQNGVGIEKSQGFVDLYPGHTIVMCAIYGNYATFHNCVIHQYSPSKLEMGIVEGQDLPKERSIERMKVFGNLIIEAGAIVNYSEDIQLQKWMKHILNGSMSGTVGVTRINSGDFWRLTPETAIWTKRIMKEIAAVAASLGHHIPDEFLDYQIAYSQKNTGVGRSSMLTDSSQNRPMEVETFFGTPLKLAKAAGIDTPCLETVYTMARAVHVRNCVMRGLIPAPEGFMGVLDDRGVEKVPYVNPFEQETMTFYNKPISWAVDYTKFQVHQK